MVSYDAKEVVQSVGEYWLRDLCVWFVPFRGFHLMFHSFFHCNVLIDIPNHYSLTRLKVLTRSSWQDHAWEVQVIT